MATQASGLVLCSRNHKVVRGRTQECMVMAMIHSTLVMDMMLSEDVCK